MKQTEHGTTINQLCFSGIIAFCLVMSFLLDTNAQATIITDGEDSRLERSSRQPTELLLNLGISLDEIEEELKPHPRIFVRGAGFAHNAELEQVLAKNSDVLQSLGISVDLARERLQSRVRIFVKGAGFGVVQN